VQSAPDQELTRIRLRSCFIGLTAILIASSALPATLPGFRLETIAPVSGFCSSVVADSHGVVYYTTTDGGLFRVEGGSSIPVAQLTTRFVGNSGLLGMALLDDRTAVVHYTTPDITADVISRIDLETGHEQIVHEFVCDVEMPSRSVDSEHHGGIPAVAPDGTIFIGIGDYGAFDIAAMPQWNAGKIFRIDPDGSVMQLASGFRNPFELAWDERKQRLIVPDNGDAVDDEINIITTGGFYGWPFTMGLAPPVDDSVPPIYTFAKVVAPTGITALTGSNPMLRQGYLLSTFVAKAIYLIPDIDARPLPDPIALVDHEVGPIVDVTQSQGGDIYLTTGLAIYRLVVPLRGDCNGDGLVNAADLTALDRELADGDPHPMVTAQDGSYRASWGCDVDGDGLISSADRAMLLRMLTVKARAVRR
jgi:glucose/arabinose dehydrogenase